MGVPNLRIGGLSYLSPKAIYIVGRKVLLSPYSGLCHFSFIIHTVRLTSIYYQILGYPELLVAPDETIIGMVKKYEVSLRAQSEDEDLWRYVWS